MDVEACLRMGLTGALGALPGTCAAHPMDVLKISLQTAPASSSGPSYSTAARSIHAASGWYRGLRPALEQRATARFPMFFLSELYTQLVERHTGLSGTEARGVGSVGSGYTTGVLASLAEYRKKLLAVQACTVEEASILRIVGTARATGHVPSLLRRAHAAGACSAAYDGAFFSTQHHLAHERGWAAAPSYGAAAAAAVLGSFFFDTCVARMMVVPPGQRVAGLLETAASIIRSGGVAAGFRGVGARVCEFGISYTVTGAMSVLVLRLWPG